MPLYQNTIYWPAKTPCLRTFLAKPDSIAKRQVNGICRILSNWRDIYH